MALTDVTIASRAMVLAGIGQISDFDNEDTPSVVANELYETIITAALTTTRWRFATGQQQLQRNTAAPEARWDASYQMPTNPQILLLHAVTVLDYTIKYDRYEDKIYCDAVEDDVVIADYTYRPNVTEWPPYFTKAVIFELASIFAAAIATKVTLADALGRQAEMWYTKARNAEAQSQTTRKIKPRNLSVARRRNGRLQP